MSQPFSFDNVLGWYTFEGRPAVTVEMPNGALAAFLVPRSATPGDWQPVAPPELHFNAHPLSREDFFKRFHDQVAQEK